MKKFLAFCAVLILVSPVWAEACVSCGDKNHFNIHNNYGGKAHASAYNISKQWVSQSQQVNVAPGAFTNNVTTGPTSVGVTVNGSGGGAGTGELSGYVIQNFPDPYVPIPASPMPYNGTLKESSYATDQMWFKRTKWTRSMVENLPDKGKVTDAIFEKTKAVEFTYIKDGRTPRQWCEDEEKEAGACKSYTVPKGHYFLGPVYCESGAAGDKPGLVWGGCSRRLLDKGCTYSVLESAVVNQGVRSNAVNQGGGVSLAGIFGAIFGFNAGAGAGNTDHEATAYEIVTTRWGCYGVQPTTDKK